MCHLWGPKSFNKRHQVKRSVFSLQSLHPHLQSLTLYTVHTLQQEVSRFIT